MESKARVAYLAQMELMEPLEQSEILDQQEPLDHRVLKDPLELPEM